MQGFRMGRYLANHVGIEDALRRARGTVACACAGENIGEPEGGQALIVFKFDNNNINVCDAGAADRPVQPVAPQLGAGSAYHRSFHRDNVCPWTPVDGAPVRTFTCISPRPAILATTSSHGITGATPSGVPV